jgi:hypothetical protein
LSAPFSFLRYQFSSEAAETFRTLEEAALEARKNRHEKKKAKSSRQEGRFKQVHKTIELLSQNPRHLGLNTHEYSLLRHPYDPKKKMFEAYAQNQTPSAYRVFRCYGPEQNEITIIAITSHP